MRFPKCPSLLFFTTSAKYSCFENIHFFRKTLFLSVSGTTVSLILNFVLPIKHQILFSLVATIMSDQAWGAGFDPSSRIVFSWNFFTGAGCLYTNGLAQWGSVCLVIFSWQKRIGKNAGTRKCLQHTKPGTYEIYVGPTMNEKTEETILPLRLGKDKYKDKDSH